MLSTEIGVLVFLITLAIALKIATGNNTRLIQPFAQFLGLVCFSLVVVGLIIG